MLKHRVEYNGDLKTFVVGQFDDEGHIVPCDPTAFVTWGDFEAIIESLCDCIVEDLTTHLRSHEQQAK